MTELDFTGEQFVPGKTSKRMEEDFFARYEFSFKFVKDKRVLDIACGAGYGSYLLKKFGLAKSVDGVDIDSEIINYAKNHFQAEGINFSLGDLVSWGRGDGYDVITCFESIEHIDDYEGALKNLFNLTNNGGVVIITTPNRIITSPNCASLNDKPGNPFHFREFTVSELRSGMEQAGFYVGPSDIYGSRQQIYFKNKYLRRLYKILFKPDIKSKSDFQKLHSAPRYFMIIGHKRV